jgi:hypothetical protein
MPVVIPPPDGAVFLHRFETTWHVEVERDTKCFLKELTDLARQSDGAAAHACWCDRRAGKGYVPGRLQREHHPSADERLEVLASCGIRVHKKEQREN